MCTMHLEKWGKGLMGWGKVTDQKGALNRGNTNRAEVVGSIMKWKVRKELQVNDLDGE